MFFLGPIELVFVMLYLVFGVVIFPVIIGRYADRKGRSFALFVFLSIFLTPILGSIIALLTPASRPEEIV